MCTIIWFMVLKLTWIFPPLLQMLELSDKDFEGMHLTAGARRKLRVHLEVLRCPCFNCFLR